MNLWTVAVEHPPFFYSLAALLGLLVGSFVNVLAYRLPVMLDHQWQREAQEMLGLPQGAPTRLGLCLPASHCPRCQQRIRAWQNIPVLSYLFLRGRCAGCQGRISVRYPLVELGCALLSLGVAWHFGPGVPALLVMLLTWGLLALSLIDADRQLLPDVLVLPLLWLGLVVNAFGLLVPLPDALWGAVAGYLSLWSVYWLFRLLTGKEGMGYGDFKLLAMLGAWGGWQILPMTVMGASVAGALIGLVLLGLRRANRGTTLPFGPYLAIAGWIALLWGDEIAASYLQLLGTR